MDNFLDVLETINPFVGLFRPTKIEDSKEIQFLVKFRHEMQQALAEINGKLDSIDKKLDDIIKHLERKDLAQIISGYRLGVNRLISNILLKYNKFLLFQQENHTVHNIDEAKQDLLYQCRTASDPELLIDMIYERALGIKQQSVINAIYNLNFNINSMELVEMLQALTRDVCVTLELTKVCDGLRNRSDYSFKIGSESYMKTICYQQFQTSYTLF